MKNIINCALLDAKITKPYLKSIIFLLAFGIFMGIITKSGDWIVTFTAMMIVFIISYPFQVAEKNKLDTLYGTLPIKRNSIVFGRYLFAVGFLVVGLLIAFIGYIIITLVFGKALDFTVLSLMICLIITVALLVVSIQYPILFKYGFTKGRIWAYVPLFIIFGLVALLPIANSTFNWGLTLAGVFGFFITNAAITCVLIITIGVVALAASCYLSNRIYAKKDIV